MPALSGRHAVNEDDPLSEGEVAAYLDGRLEGAELARVEAHLADDPSARQEIIKAGRIIASAPRRAEVRFRWLPATAGLAAIAALALIAVKPLSNGRDAAAISSERRGSADQFEKINLITPTDGEHVGVAERSFVWRPIEGATYMLVISDRTGLTLLSMSTTDTLVEVSASLFKAGGGTYYWTVDALGPDGSSVTSGVREFVVSAR